MAGLDPQLIKLAAAIDELEAGIARKTAQIAGNDLVALITTRIIQTGKNEKGQSFTPYSTRPMNAAKLKGKSRRDSAERAVTALAKVGGTMSYRKFREINGLKVDKKNFEFTGEMFRQFGVIDFSGSGGDFIVLLDGKSNESKRKLARAAKLEGGSIVEASAQEIDLLERILLKYIDNLINEALK